jgi:hypothetical protein
MTAVLRSEPDPAGTCLVAYQKEGVVALIYTLNAQNTIPLCSNCTYDKCPCYREFIKETDQKEKVINDSADIYESDTEFENIIIPWTRESRSE